MYSLILVLCVLENVDFNAICTLARSLHWLRDITYRFCLDGFLDNEYVGFGCNENIRWAAPFIRNFSNIYSIPGYLQMQVR